MAAFAYPTPVAASFQRRQIDDQSTYITVSSALVLTAPVNSLQTELPLDTNTDSAAPINTDPDAYQSVTFEGVGGTIAANTLITTSTSVAPTTTLAAPAETSASTNSAPKQSVPVGALIAAFAAVAALCLLLVILFWWRRRKRHHASAEKERWRMHRETGKSFVGGHGNDKEMEGPWEEFKGSSISSAGVHTPGILPSPPSTGKQYSYADSGRAHLLANMPMPPNNASSGPRPPRRHSVKSTVTGKVNPSNNFASEGHDETLEDEYDPDDSKSTRSRMPLTPGSGHLTFHGAGAGFEGMRTLGPPPKMEGGDPSSFLTFRSGEMDVESLRQGFSFPPQPSSNIRDLPAAQRTPTPTRTPTQKSQKGGGASQLGHGKGGEKESGSMIALTNLIAALDTPEQPRHSVMSYLSQDDKAISPVNPHAIPSPSEQAPPVNPFR